MTPSQAERLKAYGFVTPICVVPAMFGKTIDRARTLGGVRSWCIKNLKESFDVYVTRHEAWTKSNVYLSVVCISKADQDKVRAFFG